MNTLTKNIMRDVYTAYAIHMATRPVVRYGVLTIVLLYILAKLVFVAAVIANAEAVGLAQLPTFAFGALEHTSFITLATFFGICLFAFLALKDAVAGDSLRVQIAHARA